MTPSTTYQARIHRVSEGVVASYIHDISTKSAVGAPSATARRHRGHAEGRATRVVDRRPRSNRRRAHGPVIALQSTAGVGNGPCTVTPPSMTSAWPVT